MAFLLNPITQNPTLLSSILLLCLSYLAAATPDTTIQLVQCNGATYSKAGDPFTISLAYVLAELQTATPSHNGYDFRNISPYPNAFAYGHASCNQTLTQPDCATCLRTAQANLLGSCDGHIGGRAVLTDCSIRYEQYPFDD